MKRKKRSARWGLLRRPAMISVASAAVRPVGRHRDRIWFHRDLERWCLRIVNTEAASVSAGGGEGEQERLRLMINHAMGVASVSFLRRKAFSCGWC